MVNHPNRKKMGWAKDGDQWVMRGSLGTYRITEWLVAGASNFAIALHPNSSKSVKGIGEFSALKNAQWAAEQYDGYRA
jgi:hypothetical protein